MPGPVDFKIRTKDPEARNSDKVVHVDTSEPVRLTDEQIDQIADRVIQRLMKTAQPQSSDQLVKTLTSESEY